MQPVWFMYNRLEILSNCHSDEVAVVNRKAKDGIRLEISCPKSTVIKVYGKGHVSDQFIGF